MGAESNRKANRSNQDIQEWIVKQISREAHIDPHKIDLNVPLLSYSLDSMKQVVFISELEEWLGIRFNENPLDPNMSIAELVEHLNQFIAQSK